MLASAFDDVVTHVKALLEQDGEEAARRLEEALKPLPEDVVRRFPSVVSSLS